MHRVAIMEFSSVVPMLNILRAPSELRLQRFPKALAGSTCRPNVTSAKILLDVLSALAVLHAAAGLKHHFIDRDDVQRSMLPRLRIWARGLRLAMEACTHSAEAHGLENVSLEAPQAVRPVP
jgi:hypothetical protein